MADDYALIGGAPGSPGSVPIKDNGHMHEGTAVKSLGDKTRYPDTEEGLKQVMRSEMDDIMGNAHFSLSGLLGTLFGGLGEILSGAVQFAGGILMAAVDGVVSLIGFIGQSLESAWSWLTGRPRHDIPENFMPLEASAYAVLEPVKTGVDEALESARSAEAEMLLVRDELAVLLPEIAADVEESQRLLGEARDQLTAAQESNDRTQQVVDDAVASAASSADLALAKAQEAIAMVDAADLILVEVRSLNVLAEGHAESAQGHATTASGHAQTAQNLVNEGRGVLSDTAALKAAAEGYVESALGHANTASGHAQTAQGLVDEGRGVLADTTALKTAVEGHVATAKGHANTASSHAQTAQNLVDEGRGVLADTTALKTAVEGHATTAQSAATSARQARDAAASSLTSARGVLDQVEGANEDVQALHTQVLGLHQDTLTKHGEAIGAAADAADALADAVTVQKDVTTKHSQVLTKHSEVLTKHGEAIGAAADATDALADAVLVQKDVTTKHSQVLTKHSEAIGAASAAAGSAADAAADAAAGLLIQQDITTKHGEVLTKHGEAINAASAAAGSASAAAADVAAGLLVQQDITTKHGEVLTKHGQAIQASATAAQKASDASNHALSAAQALAQTQATHTSTLALHGEVITKHGDAIGKLSNAVQLQEEAERLQAIINRNTLTALEVHANLMKWHDDTRTRIGAAATLTGNPGPWNSVVDGRVLVRSANSRSRVEWTAPGAWAGRVSMFIAWETETLTGDDYFTQHFYNVGPGYRGTTYNSPRSRQNVVAVTVFVEPWWGMEKREFVIQVAGADDGQFVPTDAYESPLTMVTFPNGMARQPVTFPFDVTADYPVRSGPPGGSQVWIDAGSRIQAHNYIVPAHQAGSNTYPAVVKFTEM